MRLLFLLGLLACATAVFTPTIVNPDAVNLVKQYLNSSLYSIPAAGYDDPILLVNLQADTRYDIGYAYGYMLGQEITENFAALMHYLIGNATWAEGILDDFLMFQWNRFLGRYTPQQFLDELQGVADGSAAAGNSKAGNNVIQGLVLSSFATDFVVFDVETLLGVECKQLLPPTSPLYKLCSMLNSEPDSAGTRQLVEEVQEVFSAVARRARMGCSMFGVWGNRTVDGVLFTGRNLDWSAQTGVAKNKLITVFHPPGGYVYATVGFAGLYGALTGMSAEGITVHEAGDDNFMETFEGLAWSLRLRDVMERASTLSEAQAVWAESSNTMGLNHGFGSANDNQFMALEVKAGYTAFFLANDPREANFKGPTGQSYGAPMPEALWRTNHAYDPEWLTTARNKYPGDDTELRYMLIHDTILAYDLGTLDFAAAVNITAVPGDKGGPVEVSSFVSCAHASDGSNIISATYMPGAAKMYVAFENGFGQSHVPACCNSYVALDMSTWFS